MKKHEQENIEFKRKRAERLKKRELIFKAKKKHVRIYGPHHDQKENPDDSVNVKNKIFELDVPNRFDLTTDFEKTISFLNDFRKYSAIIGSKLRLNFVPLKYITPFGDNSCRDNQP